MMHHFVPNILDFIFASLKNIKHEIHYKNKPECKFFFKKIQFGGHIEPPYLVM